MAEGTRLTDDELNRELAIIIPGPTDFRGPREQSVRSGRLEALKLVIERGPELSREELFYALNTALARGTPEMVAYMLDMGAPMSYEGHSCLINALHDAEKCKLLVARNIDVNEGTKPPVVELCDDYFLRQNEASQIATLNVLASTGKLDVNASKTYGLQDEHSYVTTALHAAAAAGHIKLCERLIELGADTKAKNINKETPLHAAINGLRVQYRNISAGDQSRADLCTRLILHGVDRNAQDRNGKTVLHLAAAKQQKKVCGAILRAYDEQKIPPCDPNIPDGKGGTPLHDTGKDPDVAVLLIKHGAKPNIQDKQDKTPLHKAASKKFEALCKALIKHGARANIEDKEGRKPSDCCPDVDLKHYLEDEEEKDAAESMPAAEPVLNKPARKKTRKASIH